MPKKTNPVLSFRCHSNF